MGDKIRWGVHVDRADRHQEGHSGHAALAARHGRRDRLARPERARRAAAELGIPKAYGSYEELLADPEIDAIYNPLPNNLHVDWTIEAVAGRQARALREADRHECGGRGAAASAVAGERHIMEAFMVRHHPQWLRARELVRQGAIGELRAVQVFFAYDNRDPENIRNMPETGGGALLDIGCYGIVSGRFTFEAEPTRVVSLIDRDSAFGTDRLALGHRRFRRRPAARLHRLHADRRASARDARRHEGADRDPHPLQRAADGGDAHPHRRRQRSSAAPPASRRSFPPVDQYAEEADAFARAVLGETELPYGVDDAIANMQILDAIFRSEQSGRWESTGL